MPAHTLDGYPDESDRLNWCDGDRSKPVACFLARQGYKEVYNMTDGIVGWYRNGFPIQR
jgi:hypothetical protein